MHRLNPAIWVNGYFTNYSQGWSIEIMCQHFYICFPIYAVLIITLAFR